MCTNGINTGQFEQMIDQIDDHIQTKACDGSENYFY